MAVKVEIAKWASILLAIATFGFGVYTYRDTATDKLRVEKADSERQLATRRIEATRPFLDRQLALYMEATSVTAKLATSTDKSEVSVLTKRFEELYWGDLALVERGGVATAMVDFRRALTGGDGQDSLKSLALGVAHACRDELAVSWGTDAWRLVPTGGPQ